MKRIWNALIYGDTETRKCIGSVIFFSVLAVVLIIIGGISGEFNIFIFGMLAVIVAIMISQTFTLVDDDFVAEVNKEGDKETVRSVSVQKNGLIYGTESKKTSQSKSSKQNTRQLHNMKKDVEVEAKEEEEELVVPVEKTDKRKSNQEEDGEKWLER